MRYLCYPSVLNKYCCDVGRSPQSEAVPGSCEEFDTDQKLRAPAPSAWSDGCHRAVVERPPLTDLPGARVVLPDDRTEVRVTNGSGGFTFACERTSLFGHAAKQVK